MTSDPRPEGDPRIALAIAGDRRAAESLLAELLPRVRNVVRYMIRGDADVDDVTQDALVLILRSLPSFRGDSSVKTWASVVATRAALTALRQRKRAQSRWSEVAPESVPEDVPGGAERYTARREVAKLLDTLPDDQRHALVLHHSIGMSIPEIAETLEVPAETVRSRLRLGAARLRAALGLEPQDLRKVGA